MFDEFKIQDIYINTAFHTMFHYFSSFLFIYLTFVICSVVQVDTSLRIQWAGHLVKMEEIICDTQIFKRNLLKSGRMGSTREDNTDTSFKNIFHNVN
jgi:hypothetical protein